MIIKRSGEDYVKYEMFRRLNTGGSLLSAQEIRNCSSRMLSGGAAFYGALQELAQDQNFKDATVRLPEPDRERRADEELVLRNFAVRCYQESFAGNVREWLDNFMEEILFDRDGIEFDPNEFRSFLAFIANKFGDAAFSRSRDGQAFGRLAPAYFEAVAGALTDHFDELAGADPVELQAKLSNAFDGVDFKAASGPGVTSEGKLDTSGNLWLIGG
ncbi:hypothetical protein [Cribrihabitans pelagius]|uniref:hypothetical protein n=1 Tax=Cribrihabitans pelagius TaxID=1765746 RepID=UPI003B58E7E8